jgi:hypothetical protein
MQPKAYRQCQSFKEKGDHSPSRTDAFACARNDGCQLLACVFIIARVLRSRESPSQSIAAGPRDVKNSFFVKFKRYSDSPWKKKARRGFRGYPIATIAFYGPDDTRASKAAVAIITAEGAEPSALERWFTEGTDARTDPAVTKEILQFVQDHGAKSLAMADRIIGCPHEEGIDYPAGQVCPRCPFWAHRDRWSGDLLQ